MAKEGENMKINVGSENPAKVEGVKLAFEQFFNEVTIQPKPVVSGVPSQPFDVEVIEGAINRAIKAYDSCDFSVGVEAGFFKTKRTITGYVDFQVAAIYNGERFTLGFGPGFEFPPLVVERVLNEKTEAGKVMSELTGIRDIGKKLGAVHYLTKGVITRIELTRLCVTMALIPFLNPGFYFEI
mgnify:CR=1 FL=1